MGLFSKALLETRHQLGFKTAKAFYNQLVKKQLDCNYPYYKKIENGDLFPTAKVVNQIVSSLNPDIQNKLILSYCQDQFKKHSYLFGVAEIEPIKPEDSKPDLAGGQKLLTMRQINGLSQSKECYLIFVLFTMTRKPLGIVEIEKYFKKNTTSIAIQKLVELNLIYEIDKSYLPYSTEILFPKAETEQLKKYYQQFDSWDIESSDFFQFDTLIRKMLLRRVSGRYLGLLTNQIQLAFDLIKSADDLNPIHNNTVIQLQLRLKKGVLPG
jgi:hypothetical protein